MAYVIPAHKVFDEIEQRFGARPTFPMNEFLSQPRALPIPLSPIRWIQTIYHETLAFILDGLDEALDSAWRSLVTGWCLSWFYICHTFRRLESTILLSMMIITILFLICYGFFLSLKAIPGLQPKPSPPAAPDLIGLYGLLASYVICATTIFCAIQAIGELTTVFPTFFGPEVLLSTSLSAGLGVLIFHIFDQQSIILLWPVGFVLPWMVFIFNIPSRHAKFRPSIVDDPLGYLTSSALNRSPIADNHFGSLTTIGSLFDSYNLWAIACGWVTVQTSVAHFPVSDQIWCLAFYAITVTWLGNFLSQNGQKLVPIDRFSSDLAAMSNILDPKFGLSSSTIPSKNREQALVLQNTRDIYKASMPREFQEFLRYMHVSKTHSSMPSWLHRYERGSVTTYNLSGRFAKDLGILDSRFFDLFPGDTIRGNILQRSTFAYEGLEISRFVQNQNPSIERKSWNSSWMQHYQKHFQIPRPLTWLVSDRDEANLNSQSKEDRTLFYSAADKGHKVSMLISKEILRDTRTKCLEKHLGAFENLDDDFINAEDARRSETSGWFSANKNYLKWMDVAPDYSELLSLCGKPGAGKNYLKRRQFAPVLSFVGKTGVGKSSIARYEFDQLQESNLKYLFFFFNKPRLNACVRSLDFQVSMKHEVISEQYVSRIFGNPAATHLRRAHFNPKGKGQRGRRRLDFKRKLNFDYDSLCMMFVELWITEKEDFISPQLNYEVISNKARGRLFDEAIEEFQQQPSRHSESSPRDMTLYGECFKSRICRRTTRKRTISKSSPKCARDARSAMIMHLKHIKIRNYLDSSHIRSKKKRHAVLNIRSPTSTTIPLKYLQCSFKVGILIG